VDQRESCPEHTPTRVRTAGSERSFLRSVTAGYRQGTWPTSEELRKLVEMCRDPRHDFRETALTLLLSPPAAHDSAYLPWLLERLPTVAPSTREMPVELLEHLLEIVGFLQATPGMPKVQGWLATILRNLPASGLRWLFAGSLPAAPFLPVLSTRSIAWLFQRKANRSRDLKRWRLLRRRLLSRKDQGGWASLSTNDVGRLWPGRLGPSAKQPGAGRYRRVARALASSAAGGLAASPPAYVPSGRIGYWDGAGSHTLSYWEAMVRQLTEELRSVRNLAKRVSEHTGRVVLSCHNATLAACSGWGMDLVHRQFSDKRAWQSLEEAALRALGQHSVPPVPHDDEIERLWGLYAERLIHPKIKQGLWESRLRALLGGASAPGWERDFELAGRYLDRQSLAQISEGTHYGWTGSVSPHQRLRLEEIMAWQETRRASWKPGLLLLAIIISEGQRLLDAGRLRQLVVPWIDKFFISSLREQDLDFFPRILRWLEQRGCRPLVLLWDDTAHGHSPSLQLAMAQLQAKVFPCRGIGVFDWAAKPVPRAEAEQFIVQHHQEGRFFALRPFSDCHNPRSLRQILEQRDHTFLRSTHYDSSWKDNLAFLYAGTQVAPLLSVPGDAEAFPAWMVAGGRKLPFGSFLRSSLRQMLFGNTEGELESESLAKVHAAWANLL
jgi:hypothetical protein